MAPILGYFRDPFRDASILLNMHAAYSGASKSRVQSLRIPLFLGPFRFHFQPRSGTQFRPRKSKEKEPEERKWSQNGPQMGARNSEKVV